MNGRALIALVRTFAIVVMALMVAPEAVPAQRDETAVDRRGRGHVDLEHLLTVGARIARPRQERTTPQT